MTQTKTEGKDAATEKATKDELEEAQPVAYSSPLDQAAAEQAVRDAVRVQATKSKEPDAQVAFEAPRLGEDRYRGPDWAGIPNYYCPWCPFSSTAGEGAVHEHVVGTHADKLRAPEA